MGKVLFPKLSYEIIGSLYEVYNNLGYGHREKTYQNALSQEFTNRGISFQRELYFPIHFKGKLVSRYFIDFLIDNKIVLELKVSKDFYQNDTNQILAYMRTNKFRLGIIAIFTDNGVKFRRILN